MRVLNDKTDSKAEKQEDKPKTKASKKKESPEEAAAREARIHRRKMRQTVALLLREAADTWDEQARVEPNPDIELSIRAKALRSRVMARHAERGHLCLTRKEKTHKTGTYVWKNGKLVEKGSK